MAKVLTVLVLFTNVLVLKCQEEELLENAKVEKHSVSEGKPRYSFSYGVSDAKTGDLKSVWEAKDGDTVKGHYSVLEPDGSMRTVEYSAGPKSGFKAMVKNDGMQSVPNGEARSMFDEKSYKDYEKAYDFSEEQEYQSPYHHKRSKYPYEALKEYYKWKKPKYPTDLEASDYTHSITIKHPKEDSSSGESHSHVDMKNNLYNNILELSNQKTKHPLHPGIPLDTFKKDYEKYTEPSHYDLEKLVSPYSLEQYKLAKLAEAAFKHKYKGYSMFEPDHPIPDMPAPEKYFEDASPPRPKKKRKPYRESELPYGDLDDFILVPKKKYKQQQRPYETDYIPEAEEDFERPFYATEDDDDRHYKPPREKPAKEVIRKIVKKRKPPLMKLLDIWDI